MTETPVKLIQGVDFEYDEKGLMVMTADYLMRRGYCCESGCRNCPYGYQPKKNDEDAPKKKIYRGFEP